MSSGCNFLEQHQKRLSTVGEVEFVVAHERFVYELATRQDDPAEGLDANQRIGFAAFFSQCQRRYLAIKEREANEEMMAVLNGDNFTALENISNSFGRDAYERVSDLQSLIDFCTCRSVVMVGCGAFPATLFWLLDHHPGASYVGLDIDPRCIEKATEVIKAMGVDKIHFGTIDGSHYDFDGVDLVYVANQVIPKKAVLDQASRSDSVTHVVVREPTSRGELLAEAVRHDVPSGFVVENKGSESSTFLSYDLLLSRPRR